MCTRGARFGGEDRPAVWMSSDCGGLRAARRVGQPSIAERQPEVHCNHVLILAWLILTRLSHCQMCERSCSEAPSKILIDQDSTPRDSRDPLARRDGGRSLSRRDGLTPRPNQSRLWPIAALSSRPGHRSARARSTLPAVSWNIFTPSFTAGRFTWLNVPCAFLRVTQVSFAEFRILLAKSHLSVEARQQRRDKPAPLVRL